MKKSTILLVTLLPLTSNPAPSLSVDGFFPGTQTNTITLTVSNTVASSTNTFYFSPNLTNWVILDQVRAPGASYTIIEHISSTNEQGFFQVKETTP